MRYFEKKKKKMLKNWVWIVVWENFREDYTTLALFAGIKGTILVTILIVSSQNRDIWNL